MEEYLNKGIKDLITQFPGIEPILDEYNIGCDPSNVGKCRLRDSVDIYTLEPADEQRLMAGIAAVLYPDKDIKIPEIKKNKNKTAKAFSYSPPIKKLVEEHKLIKRLLALIPSIITNLDIASEEGKTILRDCVDFIRSYADKFHHAKEEDILFKYFDESLDIIKVIYEDHDTGRGHVAAVLKAIEAQDKEQIIVHLNGYRDLLTEHIKKEDEILYTWMDRNLSTNQVGSMFTKFNKVDEEFGDVPAKYEAFIVDMEKRFDRRIKES